MSDRSLEHQYRVFLLTISALLLVGTVVELLLTEHAETFVQLIPFYLSGLGLAAMIWVLVAPRRTSMVVLRGITVLLLAGSLYGMYQHVAHNIAFELEIRPNAGVGEVLGDALHGASPLLAPGVLGLAGVLAAAATYRHPALAKKHGQPESERSRVR